MYFRRIGFELGWKQPKNEYKASWTRCFFPHLFCLAKKWRNSTTQKKNSHVNLKIIRQSDSNFKINFDNYSLFGIWNSLLGLSLNRISNFHYSTNLFLQAYIRHYNSTKSNKKEYSPNSLIENEVLLTQAKTQLLKEMIII